MGQCVYAKGTVIQKTPINEETTGYAFKRRPGSNVERLIMESGGAAFLFIKAAGTHYDVGRKIGSEAKHLIQKYFHNDQNIPNYIGKSESQQVFIRNLLEFEALYGNFGTFRCTDLLLNTQTAAVIGHNEDGESGEHGSSYIIDAHYFNVSPRGRLLVPEERFVSFCYPGSTFAYNIHGMVSTINYIVGKHVKNDRLPMNVLLRATLSATNLDHLIEIIRNKGIGIGFPVSMNVAFLSNKQTFYTFEIFTQESDDKSQTDFKIMGIKKEDGEQTSNCAHVSDEFTYGYYYHCNHFRHIAGTDAIPPCSRIRTTYLETNPAPKTKSDIHRILTNKMIIRPIEVMGVDSYITLATVIFDLCAEQLEIYTSRRQGPEVPPDIILKINDL
ncbi:beta-alanyl-dopamine/carcinine hydrolase-like isoform X2 [Tubulanus polymorphus]|uniref:beta-alanyl-dopamine/carcinine hydrolase-like isoform X2 n=1 Tax=Tubulanus polymorphus TaxID=672921 RepID=UPI003DA2222C